VAQWSIPNCANSCSTEDRCMIVTKQYCNMVLLYDTMSACRTGRQAGRQAWCDAVWYGAMLITGTYRACLSVGAGAARLPMPVNVGSFTRIGSWLCGRRAGDRRGGKGGLSTKQQQAQSVRYGSQYHHRAKLPLPPGISFQSQGSIITKTRTRHSAQRIPFFGGNVCCFGTFDNSHISVSSGCFNSLSRSLP
jgi:hypothetical protein